MAHTIRLWPRVMSPQTNTPGTLVDHEESAATVPRALTSRPSSATTPFALGPQEPHGQQHQLAVQLELGSLHGEEFGPAVRAVGDLDLLAAEGPDMTGAVVEELGGGHREDPLAALLEGGRRTQDERPGRPRVVPGPVRGGFRHDLQLVHAEGPLAMDGAQAVGPGVPAPDDHHVLALGRHRRRRRTGPLGPGWTASGSPWPGGSRPAPGPAPAGRGAGWPRRPAPRRRTRPPGPGP